MSKYLFLYVISDEQISEVAYGIKCSTYTHDIERLLGAFIRTTVLKKIVISELNKLLETVHTNEVEFVRATMDNFVQSQENELKKAKKFVKQYEKRVAELDKLFTCLYEDNVSGKISDKRFDIDVQRLLGRAGGTES